MSPDELNDVDWRKAARSTATGECVEVAVVD
jgi:hypothetical protein